MLELAKRKTLKEMAHCDGKSVAVRDFVVYNGLNVDGLQLEINCNIDQSGKTIYSIEFLACSIFSMQITMYDL